MSTKKSEPDKKPPGVVIYRFSTIVSHIMEKFLDDFRDQIIEDDDGINIFSRVYKRNHIMNVFHDYVDNFFKIPELHPYGQISTVVVGTCYGHHNWMYEFKNELDDNDYRKKLVNSRLALRYVFSDRKFKCDELELNEAFDAMFRTFMMGEHLVVTPNYNMVKWLSVKDVSEFDMVKLVASQHMNTKIFPRNRKNLMVDVNDLIYDQLRKKHKIPKLYERMTLGVYDLVCKSQNLENVSYEQK